MSDATVQVSMPDIVLEPDELLKLIIAYPAMKQRIKETFKSKAPAEVREHLKDELEFARDYKHGAVAIRFNNVLQDASKLTGGEARQFLLDDHLAQCLGTFDTKQKNELNKTIAKHLVNGGDLPKIYIQWIAQNIVDPNRLKYKRGRRSRHLLHTAICRWTFFLKVVMGYTIVDAHCLISDAYPMSDEALRNIWFNTKNQYKNLS